MVILFCLILIPLSLLTCSDALGDRSFGIEDRSSSWTTRLDGETQTAGIAQGAITVFKLTNGTPPGVTVGFWTDSGNGLSGSGTGQSGTATYQGAVTGRNGKQISINVVTTDGATAKVSIGEKKYEKIQGMMFLISTSGDKPRVKKMKLNQKELPQLNDIKALTKYALETSAIREFWERKPEVSESSDAKEETQAGGEIQASGESTSGESASGS